MAIKDLSSKGRSLFIHKYNTRFSTKLKNIYVDLSNSTIDIPIEKKDNEQQFSNDLNLLYLDSRRQRNDSSEFEFECDSGEHYKYLENKVMDRNVRLCGGTNNQNTWIKYVYALCAVGMLYIYIQVIHNGENILKMYKEIDALKHESHKLDSSRKLLKLEHMLTEMKHDQDLYQHSLKYTINKEMEKFSADKTGRTDFALETSGGKILSLIPGTENFDNAKTLFGITLCEGMHGPRAMLQPDMSPGHCWAIKGTQGGAIIKLLGRVKIDAVTMEHISQNISPTGEISSAPKEFSVWGLNKPNDRGQQLGTFRYDIVGPLVQTFSIENTNYFEYVEFKILSNQGHPEFTCVYRFRVHGHLENGNIKM